MNEQTAKITVTERIELNGKAMQRTVEIDIHISSGIDAKQAAHEIHRMLNEAKMQPQ